jgi:diacylglycerol kinase (ATP)
MANDILDDSAKSVVISINPSSGSTDRRQVVEELAAELKHQGFDVHSLTDIEAVKSVVAKLAGQSQLRAVVAAGGDGTVSLLANSLPPQTPIAILPLGTENLLAKYIGLTADPKSIAEMIAHGSTVKLDSGRANGQLFLVMASCGFDADVVHRVHSQRTGHIQHSSYIKPIVSAISTYRYPKIRIRPDGQENPIIGKWAFVFNVPRYAMNLPIVSDADPRDAQLDLCTFRGGNLIRGLFYLFAILLRQHRGWKVSHFQRFQRVTIEADDRVPYQLDGDPGGVLPLTIEVIPEFLKVLVPQDWDPPST